MGDRLASAGYAVLVVNPYYRQAQAPVVPEGASFRDAAIRETVMPLARSLSPETNVTDAKAFVAFLDAQAPVDTERKIGTTGYCMGGPMTMRTAAAVPDRIGAGASFHGGGLQCTTKRRPNALGRGCLRCLRERWRRAFAAAAPPNAPSAVVPPPRPTPRLGASPPFVVALPLHAMGQVNPGPPVGALARRPVRHARFGRGQQ